MRLAAWNRSPIRSSNVSAARRPTSSLGVAIAVSGRTPNEASSSPYEMTERPPGTDQPRIRACCTRGRCEYVTRADHRGHGFAVKDVEYLIQPRWLADRPIIDTSDRRACGHSMS